MRTIVKLMLGLAVTALFGAAATSALASPVWRVCTNLEAKIGLFEDKGCSKEKAESEYEWLEVNGSDTVRLTALSLRLEDAKGELGAAIIAKCSHAAGGIGLVEGGNLLLVREAKLPSPSSECTAEGTGLFKVCKTSNLEAVEGTDLPWREETYEETEGKFISRIQPDGAGEPGWRVKCAGVEDKCSSEGAGTLEETSGENKVTEGVLLVLDKFKEAHPSDCSVGGAKQGHVAGFLAISAENGAGLKVAEPWVARKPEECRFTKMGNECSVTFTNITLKALKVAAVAMLGKEGNNRFEVTAGCTPKTLLEDKEQPNKSCTDAFKMKREQTSTSFNSYLISVTDGAGGSYATAVELRIH